MMDKVTGQCPQITTFEEKGELKQVRTEPSAYQPNALPPARPNRLTPFLLKPTHLFLGHQSSGAV